MLAFKTGYKDRTSDDYYLLLIPHVKLKLSFIENASYLVLSKIQLSKNLKKCMVGLRNVSKFAFITFMCSVENFLKPNNMERKAIHGSDIMFSQPNRNELKSKKMMVIFLPLDHVNLWSKASLQL